MSTLAAFLVAVNPAAVAASIPRSALFRVRANVAFATTAVVAGVLAACSEPLLDLLDVSAPTFRIAAGAVLGVASIRWVVAGARFAGDDDVPLFTVLLSPQLAAVAIAAGTEVGAVSATLAAVVALVAAGVAVLWRDRVGPAVWSWAARLVGVAGVALAAALIVDGVNTV